MSNDLLRAAQTVEAISTGRALDLTGRDVGALTLDDLRALIEGQPCVRITRKQSMLIYANAQDAVRWKEPPEWAVRFAPAGGLRIFGARVIYSDA